MGVLLPLAVALLPWGLPLLAICLPIDRLLRFGGWLLKYKYTLLVAYLTITALALSNVGSFTRTQKSVDTWVIPVEGNLALPKVQPSTQQDHMVLPWLPKLDQAEMNKRNSVSTEEARLSKEGLLEHLHELRDGSIHLDELERRYQLPTTLTDTVQVSLLFEYWGGTGRSARHAYQFVKQLKKLKLCMRKRKIKHEILINVDSPFIRDGDIPMLNRILGRHDYVLLSNNLGETRAYNNLARLSRGEYLLLLQDDTPLPKVCDWAVNLIKLMDKQKETVGMIGLDTGILHVSKHDNLYEKGLLEMDPRCYDSDHRFFVEAVTCAAMGPLIVRRSLFQYLQGFNETLSRRGRPSSLLDCELSARIWLAGYVVQVVDIGFFDGVSPLDSPQSHVAWKSFDGYGMIPDMQMNASDRVRRTTYMEMFDTPDAMYAIVHGAKLFNGMFPCKLDPNVTLERRDCAIVDSHCSKMRKGSMDFSGIIRAERSVEMRNRSVSLIMQYWGGTGRNKTHAELVAKSISKIHKQLELIGGSEDMDFMINVDSRDIRNGDVGALYKTLSSFLNGYILLSPNIHELRAYNRLISLSEAKLVMLMQDDDEPPSSVDMWFRQPVELFGRWPQLGTVSINNGLLFVGNFEEAKVGEQTLEFLYDHKEYPVPRCTDANMKARIEAMRCADVGPLFVRRKYFMSIGGYNEQRTRRGEPGSVLVDCDIQARLWMLNISTLFYYAGAENQFRNRYNKHVAWQHPKMFSGHMQRLEDYYDVYENPLSEKFQHMAEQGRLMNANFDCPFEAVKKKPLSLMDCFVADAPNTCTTVLTDSVRSDESIVLGRKKSHKDGE